MTFRNTALCVAALLVAAFPAAGPAKTIVIDGDFSDWTGDSSAIPLHGNAWDDGEWIYKGEAGDARSDLPDAQPDNDIVEFRLTTDGTWLYLYFEMDNMDFEGSPHANDVLVAVTIDLDKNASDTGLNWIGPDSDTLLASAGHYAERNIAIHNVTGESDTQIELHADDGTSWYEPPTPGWKAWIDGAEDKVEAAIALADLGINLGLDPVIRVAAISLGNTGEWCNGAPPNASTQIGDIGTSDAIDVVGGSVGSSQNAWDRDLSDAAVTHFHDVDLSVNVPDWSLYAD